MNKTTRKFALLMLAVLLLALCFVGCSHERLHPGPLSEADIEKLKPICYRELPEAARFYERYAPNYSGGELEFGDDLEFIIGVYSYKRDGDNYFVLPFRLTAISDDQEHIAYKDLILKNPYRSKGVLCAESYELDHYFLILNSSESYIKELDDLEYLSRYEAEAYYFD